MVIEKSRDKKNKRKVVTLNITMLKLMEGKKNRIVSLY
jgi:hypothetical protein